MAISWRTDLAMEAKQASGEIEGVEMMQENCQQALVTRVTVRTQEGAETLGKPVGTYITIEHEGLSDKMSLHKMELVHCIAQQLHSLMGGCVNDGCALVVGLGNNDLTPDSLGPRVVSRIAVTRHFAKEMSSEQSTVRSVCAYAPGVTGSTGIETSESAAALVKAVQPSVVLLVDALAARSTARLLNTVQITDAGVAPGSGVGNHRKALNRETLGVPVIALGVPMVVHASTILRDAMEKLAGEEVQMDALLKDMDCKELVVTPAMIDEAVCSAANIVAQAIDMALQKDISTLRIGAPCGA